MSITIPRYQSNEFGEAIGLFKFGQEVIDEGS